jgi:hypothetical protein
MQEDFRVRRSRKRYLLYDFGIIIVLSQKGVNEMEEKQLEAPSAWFRRPGRPSRYPLEIMGIGDSLRVHRAEHRFLYRAIRHLSKKRLGVRFQVLCDAGGFLVVTRDA